MLTTLSTSRGNSGYLSSISVSFYRTICVVMIADPPVLVVAWRYRFMLCGKMLGQNAWGIGVWG